jgi:hypothetical protein
MADFRKAGAEILRVLESSGDPAAEADRALLYAKDSGGATKLFMRSSAGVIAEIGAAGSGSPSLSTPTAVSRNFNTFQTDLNVNLSTASKDWLSLTNGYGSASPFFNNGVNSARAVASLHTRRTSNRLATGFYWIGSFTGAGIASGAFSVTSTASDDLANVALAQTAANIEIFGGGAGYGFGFDIPMMANESGTVKIGLALHSFGYTVDASFSDGSVAPVSLAIPNFDSGGGTRMVSVSDTAFVNGANGGNRLRVRCTTSGVQGPFNPVMWPIWIYW